MHNSLHMLAVLLTVLHTSQGCPLCLLLMLSCRCLLAAEDAFNAMTGGGDRDLPTMEQEPNRVHELLAGENLEHMSSSC